ncbi:MAG: nucleoside recognition domain-containing protein [Gammaproteobacteria bacterium]
MSELVTLILEAGRSGVELALFILLPVMIIMLTLMRWLEQRGVLDWVAHWCSPLLRPLGVPGIGVFAVLQLHLVSFAAPIATLALMNRGQVSRRHIAATLAMVLAMAQANVIFPMAAVGLNIALVVGFSMLGGAVAAAMTYHWFGRNLTENLEESEEDAERMPPHKDANALETINKAGREALDICLNAIPMIVLALFAVGVLREVGLVDLLQAWVAPLFQNLGLPAFAVLPMLTKAIAGGTAMMGISMDAIQQGVISAAEFNRMAGFVVHPLDLLGIALFMTAGKRVASVIRPAIYGGLCGVLVRGLLHLLFP